MINKYIFIGMYEGKENMKDIAVAGKVILK
jgi:hypothetical protein